MSPRIPHRPGWRARSPRPSPRTPRLAFCCETAMRHMVRPSAIVFRRWPSSRSSPRRDRRGRTPMLNASSARSVENVSITSSSSMSVICAEFCRHTSSTTTKAEHISRSARIVRRLDLYSRRLQAPSSPSHKSAACTIATSGARPELFCGERTCTAVAVGACRRLLLRRSEADALRTHARRSGRNRAARSPITVNGRHGLHRNTDSMGGRNFEQGQPPALS